MTRPKPKDMSGTARCMDCLQKAVHERGPGTPLVIHHLPDCPQELKRQLEECHTLMQRLIDAELVDPYHDGGQVSAVFNDIEDYIEKVNK